MNVFFKKLFMGAVVLSAAVSVSIAIGGHLRWALGFLIGALWLVLNFSLSTTILNFLVKPVSKKKLIVALLVKFPFLYGLGFVILISHLFIVSSILWGVGVILGTVGLTIVIWQKRILNYQNYLI